MWTVTGSREVYANRWMRVVEDRVVTPAGDPGIYGIVEVRSESVFVVAVTVADEVVLVDVDRHTVGRSLEVPAGGCDGEDPGTAARRELVEETGYTARTWAEIGTMRALNGICRAPERVFLATGPHRRDGGRTARGGDRRGASRRLARGARHDRRWAHHRWRDHRGPDVRRDQPRSGSLRLTGTAGDPWSGRATGAPPRRAIR